MGVGLPLTMIIKNSSYRGLEDALSPCFRVFPLVCFEEKFETMDLYFLFISGK